MYFFAIKKTQVFEGYKMSYNNMFDEALNFFDNGNFEDAETIARQLIETSPDNPEILNFLGLIAQTKGLHSEACNYFSAALRQKPNTASYLFNLAFSLKLSNQLSDALFNYNKVLQIAPHIKETHNEIACIYEQINDIDKARTHWQAALQMEPSYLTAEINMANSYRLDAPEKASALLENLSKEHPAEAAIWYNLAWLNYNNKNFKQALEYAKQAEQLSPPSELIKYLLGICSLELNNENDAKNYFLSAEILNPDYSDAKLCIADIYSRNNEFYEAEKRYLRLIELNANNFSAHCNYAEMLHRQNRLSEALEEYRKAIIINPLSSEVSNNLGTVLKDMQEYDEALGLFFNSLSLNPSSKATSVNIWETIVILSSIDEEKARKIACNWYTSYPDNSFAKYAKSAMEGDNFASTEIFTEQLFDNFADNYEMVMQNLDYSAPMAIRRITGPLEGRIVDLGCGSGLVGMAVKNDKNHLIGVDISSNMLAKAADKNIYSELIKADILYFLSIRNDFDWIIAADVIGYLGDPEQLFNLCSNKNIIFTIEASDDTSTYQIQSNGRFKHNPDYIEKLLLKNKFHSIYKEELILRTENQIPVKGYIFKAMGDNKNG